MDKIKPKIFIVEDSKPFREVLKRYLERKIACVVVGEASNGKEFLDVFNVSDIDIVLMDIGMPILNGIETTKILHKKYANQVKIIGISQNMEFDYMKSMVEAGASGYVAKSKMSEHLINAIKAVTQGKLYFPELTK